jgi:hypothetical protein
MSSNNVGTWYVKLSRKAKALPTSAIDVQSVMWWMHRSIKNIPLQGGGASRGLALFPVESTCLAPGGVIVAPIAPHRVAPAGKTIIFHELITNLSSMTDTFDLTLSTIPWATSLSASTTGPLEPGATFSVTVTVELPAGEPQGSLQTVSGYRRWWNGLSSATGLRFAARIYLQPG